MALVTASPHFINPFKTEPVCRALADRSPRDVFMERADSKGCEWVRVSQIS